MAGKVTAPAAPKQGPRPNGKSEEQVLLLAYQKWEAAGKPIGDGIVYWLAAEQELGAATRSAAKS